ncbi:DegT/DnrJ/EryC1/StrS family aminotransferase [Nocardioides panacis]|uniref:DegT/DnrJ/EryC1/StrS family aminotransferase n=1 Tax=Nocardioides panacis TaxID=2849501 RepID=A0A975T286_9ACTN|nr:DegT/DnrJ/EryC1/StrS family aminotransferase [Nocardioides panacis]QWZ09543.1 DegT/DnrJ/EryC1/StrS family aminotransferase [Nocardioides panacis]
MHQEAMDTDRSSIPFLDLSATTDEVRPEVMTRWAELLDSNAFIGGDAVARFEHQWAAYCGTSHAVGVANGTDALHLTLRALGIGPGDEVLVPANTFVATVEGVVLAGASPRFVDVDPDTLLVTPEIIEEAVTANTRAVVVVHLYGQMPDMERIMSTARRLQLHVVEDAAQAHGATWGTGRAGSFGDAGCFSFYPGKNLGAFGDAGAVVTGDPVLAERLSSLRDHGRSRSGHHEHTCLGSNSRLDALQAVVLSAKLGRLDSWNRARRALAGLYRELLDEDVVTMVQERPGATGVHHLAVARVAQRERVREQLATVGVTTGIHYPTPCHLVPPFRRFGHARLPVVERAAGQILSLPMYPHMSIEKVERVATASNRIASGVSNR